MDKIVAIVVVIVICVGLAFVSTNDIGTEVIDRSGDIGTSIDGGTVNGTTGAITYTNP